MQAASAREKERRWSQYLADRLHVNPPFLGVQSAEKLCFNKEKVAVVYFNIL